MVMGLNSFAEVQEFLPDRRIQPNPGKAAALSGQPQVQVIFGHRALAPKACINPAFLFYPFMGVSHNSLLAGQGV